MNLTSRLKIPRAYNCLFRKESDEELIYCYVIEILLTFFQQSVSIIKDYFCPVDRFLSIAMIKI